MVLIGIKRLLQLDDLTCTWASKLGDKGSLSNTVSKVCGFGSLYQTWVRITKTQMVCYRMEELITLHHGNFAILGKWVKEFAQWTGCSNWVADWALQSQLLLDEMKKEHRGWNTACRQELNLFLLEWMFHNTAAMWHKKHQRQSQGLLLEPTEAALEHPSVQTLVGSRDSNLWWVIEQIYKGEYVVTPSRFTHAQQEDFMKELQRQLSRCMTRAGPQSKKGPNELLSRSWRHSQGLDKEDAALEVKQQNRQSWLGRRRTHSRVRSGSRWHQNLFPSCPSRHQSPSPSLPWSFPDPSLWNPRTGHGNMTPPHRRRKNQGSKFSLKYMKSWAMNQTCLQTLPTS